MILLYAESRVNFTGQNLILKLIIGKNVDWNRTIIYAIKNARYRIKTRLSEFFKHIERLFQHIICKIKVRNYTYGLLTERDSFNLMLTKLIQKSVFGI